MKRDLLQRKANLILFAVTLGLAIVTTVPALAQGRSFTPAILASNDCTVTVNAGESIRAAVSAAPAGAVVCVREGVYNEEILLTSAKNGLTLKAYPGERPVIDGQGVLPVGIYGALLQVRAAHNITLDGFEVRNSAARGISIGVPEGSLSTSNIIVRNMIVHHSGDMGIIVKGNENLAISNVLIENNVVYENLQKNITEHIGGSALTFLQARDSIARNNVVYNNHGEGIVSGRYATNTLLEGNVSYDNQHANIYILNTIAPRVVGNFVFCTDDRAFWDLWDRNGQLRAGVGIQLRDEYFDNGKPQPPKSTDQVVINNIVTGCRTNFGVATQIAGATGLIDAVVANNTFVNSRGETGSGVNNVLLEGRVLYENSRFVNNIIVQTVPGDILRVQLSQGTPDFSTFTVSNNLYWPTAPSGSTWFPSESGRVVADPLLANPALPEVANLPDPEWYALTANSPAINAGQTMAEVVTDHFRQTRSTPPDIGAVEFVQAANPGRIVVAVEATPSASSPRFSFSANFPPTDFQLGAGETRDSGSIAPGTYSVTMTPFPGWTVTEATCSDGSSPTAIIVSDGETVTCTFRNTEQPQTGTIIIRKETDPDGSTQAFSFTPSFGDAFQLADGQSKTTNDLTAGTYSVAESPLSGWTQTNATCSDGSAPASIDLAAGETVTCTFVNTQQLQTGTIIIKKETAPDGATQAFTFNASYTADFQLSDGQSHTSDALPSGIYSVSETAQAGWEQTSATCDDGSDPATIDLAAGETVTCTFINAEQQQPLGTIIVLKQTVPNGAPEQFSFGTDFSDDFLLADGQSFTSNPLGAGTYRISETVRSGWTLTSATCDDGSDPAAVELAAGETVTCTFTNTKDQPTTGTIIVRTENDPSSATQQFAFTTNYGAAFQLGHDQSNTSAPLVAGTYSVVETPVTGWTLSSATCDDGSLPGAISLAVGETVTCTFRNRQDARSGTAETIYISPRQSGSVNGVQYSHNDILAYDSATQRWSLYLDLSDMGVFRNLNSFTFLDDGSVLLTLNRNQSVGGMGTVTPRDVIRFSPTTTGANTTGTLQWYLDGSDVGLGASGEAINALAVAPDGRLLISTISNATVPTSNGALTSRDEDLLAFLPTSLGKDTAGSWSLYFDGSTVSGLAAEDVGGAWLDHTSNDLYLTVTNSFNIGGVQGNARHIIRLSPAAGGYQVQKYWYGPDFGFTGTPSAFVIKR
jgi:hypothetical protein